MEFKEFPKIPRLNRSVCITEKIDGTNACVIVSDDLVVAAQSRSRIITPEEDNYGFARWVSEHATELQNLGPGYHYGEWWGAGIQRKYGLQEKRFSLFNAGRWEDRHGTNDAYRADREKHILAPECCYVVPILGFGDGFGDSLRIALDGLRTGGSRAAPGFMQAEGVVVYHSQSKTYYKVTLEKDEEWKGKSQAQAA